MSKFTKPYKGFSVLDVTQGFHSAHQAIDCVPKSGAYGKPMVAPEKVLIERIWTPDRITTDNDDLAFGYGIAMVGQESGHRYVYWHCLPVFPVWGGDIVERGKIVAYMGNAGNVNVGGVYVPLDKRLAPEHPGTHLHQIVQVNGVPVNPLTDMDTLTEPSYTILDVLSATGKVLAKITKLLIR